MQNDELHAAIQHAATPFCQRGVVKHALKCRCVGDAVTQTRTNMQRVDWASLPARIGLCCMIILLVAMPVPSRKTAKTLPSATPASEAGGLYLRVAATEAEALGTHGPAAAIVKEPNPLPPRQEQPALSVVLGNGSTTPIWLFDEWNSAGYFNLQLDYRLADGTVGTMIKRPRDWAVNAPTSAAIGPGQCLIRKVYFDANEWKGVPSVTQNAAVEFVASFTETAQPFEPPRAWTGCVVSPPATVSLRAGR